VRPWFIWVIVVGSAVAATLSEVCVFRMVAPPDASSAVLGGLWVAMPYLAAVGLAFLIRRHPAALITLLVALVLAAVVGVFLLDASATAREDARRQAATAVLPGEDPSHGPGGMRKAGADMGEAVTGVFSILLVVVLPPMQLAAVVLPAAVAWGVSALARRPRPDDPVH
jgi:uncharacterized membrane protein YeiB